MKMFVYIHELTLKHGFEDDFELGRKQAWEITDEFERGRIIATVEDNRHYFSRAIMNSNMINMLFAISKSLSQSWFEYIFDYASDGLVWRCNGFSYVYAKTENNKTILAISLRRNVFDDYICFGNRITYEAFFAVRNYNLKRVDEKTDIEQLVRW